MPSRRTAQFELRLPKRDFESLRDERPRMVKYPEEALRSWLMEASERRVFEDSDNLSLGGTEFEIEYVFSNEFRRVEDGFEADIQVRAIWLVDPRSKGMIADDDVDTLWRFSGFPISISS